MAKFKVTITTGYVGATAEDEFEIDDAELEEMSAEEQENYIEDTAREVAFNLVEWNYKPV